MKFHCFAKKFTSISCSSKIQRGGGGKGIHFVKTLLKTNSGINVLRVRVRMRIRIRIRMRIRIRIRIRMRIRIRVLQIFCTKFWYLPMPYKLMKNECVLSSLGGGGG